MDRNLLLLPHIVVPKLILDRYHMNSWKLYFQIVRKKPFTFFLFLPSLALTVYVISEAFSFLILSVLQFQAVSFLIMRCINHTNAQRRLAPCFTTQSCKCFLTADGTAATLQCRSLSGRRMQEIRT